MNQIDDLEARVDVLESHVSKLLVVIIIAWVAGSVWWVYNNVVESL